MYVCMYIYIYTHMLGMCATTARPSSATTSKQDVMRALNSIELGDE